MAEKPAPKKTAAQPTAQPAPKSSSANAEAKPALAPAASTAAAAAPRAASSTAITPRPAAPAATSAAKGKRSIDEQERHRLIQEAAYFRSIAKGASSDPVNHWLAAEREVDQRISGG